MPERFSGFRPRNQVGKIFKIKYLHLGITPWRPYSTQEGVAIHQYQWAAGTRLFGAQPWNRRRYAQRLDELAGDLPGRPASRHPANASARPCGAFSLPRRRPSEKADSPALGPHRATGCRGGPDGYHFLVSTRFLFAPGMPGPSAGVLTQRQLTPHMVSTFAADPPVLGPGLGLDDEAP